MLIFLARHFSEWQVHAILVQLPLPKHIDEALVLSKIRVDKEPFGLFVTRDS